MLHGRNISEALASSFLNIAVWGNVRRLVEFSDAVVCVSDAQRDIVVKRMPSLALKCHTIHNPLPETTPRKVEGEDIGYFGGPDPLKGFPVLYSALKRTRSRATVRMTGFAQKNEQVGRSKLVFYERLREEEFRRVYTHVKAVVVPSIWPDPLPYVVSEGLLNRRLIIASRIGGIPELARNCPGVFLFAPGDSHRLAELIDYINDLDNHTTAKLAQTDRKTFLTEYRNEDRLQEFREIAVNMLSAHE